MSVDFFLHETGFAPTTPFPHSIFAEAAQIVPFRRCVISPFSEAPASIKMKTRRQTGRNDIAHRHPVCQQDSTALSKRKIMKILVTGGCGNMGPHIIRKLVSFGHEIRVLDRDSDGLVPFSQNGIETCCGDPGRQGIRPIRSQGRRCDHSSGMELRRQSAGSARHRRQGLPVSAGCSS